MKRSLANFLNPSVALTFALTVAPVIVLAIVLTVVVPSGVFAAAEAGDSAKSATKKKKTTDVSFEDVLVQGKYHFSDEAVTTVEQDKVLDALLGVRTDFKDRLKKSAARH